MEDGRRRGHPPPDKGSTQRQTYTSGSGSECDGGTTNPAFLYEEDDDLAEGSKIVPNKRNVDASRRSPEREMLQQQMASKIDSHVIGPTRSTIRETLQQKVPLSVTHAQVGATQRPATELLLQNAPESDANETKRLEHSPFLNTGQNIENKVKGAVGESTISRLGTGGDKSRSIDKEGEPAPQQWTPTSEGSNATGALGPPGDAKNGAGGDNPDGRRPDLGNPTSQVPSSSSSDPDDRLQRRPSSAPLKPPPKPNVLGALAELKNELTSRLDSNSEKLEKLNRQVEEMSSTVTIATNQYGILLNRYISRALEDKGIIAVQPLPEGSQNNLISKKSVAKGDKLVEEGKPMFRPECGEDDRESWDSKLTFLLATVGYAVGLGNVWRFPYLAQKNGGGAFLIPYFIMLAIEGIPIFYLELAIGQRLRKGAIGVWNQVSPYLGGIGISSAVVSFNVALYYNTIIAWCLFYLVQSFQSQLPWAECPKHYFSNGSYVLEPECLESTPTQYFWYRTTLEISESIDSPEVFNWKIAFSLLIAWVLVYLCMIKGIASSGKVVYVTATFPYIVLVIFFFRGVTLKGMSDGLKHLFTPKWYKLADPVVWLEAGTQIFFSLGLAFGGLIAFSSYNPVNNNCYRDAIMVSLTNCLTSMFAGIVVFSVIGFKATLNYEKCLEDRNNTLLSLYGKTDISPQVLSTISPELPVCDLEKELDNSASGTGLAFIIFTEAINQFPGAQFWSVLFFLMLFTLGIDSQFGTLEGVVTSIVDMKLFPNLRKEILTGVMCLTCCIISMCFAHGAGNYVFILFDNFSGNFPLLIIALCECIAVSYIYGLKRFADDIELMVGSRPGIYWLFCWKYLSPAAMILILVASITELLVEGSGYPAWDASLGTTVRHEWPTWALCLIGFLVLVAVLWIPVVAICRYMGIVLIDDNEKAWFPARDLKEFHGIVEHEVTTAETILFCIHPDGSEGLCCRTYSKREDDEEEEE